MLTIRYPSFFNLPDLSNTLEEMDRMRRRMDRLLSTYTGAGGLPGVSGVFPPLKVWEEDGKICVEAEVPGIRAEDIHISVVDRTLTLSGERRPEEVADVSFHRRERTCGSFHKAVSLPDDVDTEAVQAECKNGVLRIVIPKAEQAKPRKITVQTA